MKYHACLCDEDGEIVAEYEATKEHGKLIDTAWQILTSMLCVSMDDLRSHAEMDRSRAAAMYRDIAAAAESVACEIEFEIEEAAELEDAQ